MIRKTTSANADIIVRFSWYGERGSVLNNRSMLKGSNIYINEDFSDEMKKRITRLFPILKAARSKELKATLNKDKLRAKHIDWKHWIQYLKRYNQKTQDTKLFQFMIDGTKLVCSEQYYQYNKALRLRNNDIAEQIMKTDKAAEHHYLE